MKLELRIVKAVARAKTAYMFPNAILVSTEKKKVSAPRCGSGDGSSVGSGRRGLLFVLTVGGGLFVMTLAMKVKRTCQF